MDEWAQFLTDRSALDPTFDEMNRSLRLVPYIYYTQHCLLALCRQAVAASAIKYLSRLAGMTFRFGKLALGAFIKVSHSEPTEPLTNHRPDHCCTEHKCYLPLQRVS